MAIACGLSSPTASDESLMPHLIFVILPSGNWLIQVSLLWLDQITAPFPGRMILIFVLILCTWKVYGKSQKITGSPTDQHNYKFFLVVTNLHLENVLTGLAVAAENISWLESAEPLGD
jgi:hypothetical protein